VARQTRAQRRARREAQQASGGGGIAQRARQRQQQIRPSQQPAKSQAGAQRRERRGSFFAESWAELKKVEWPSQAQVIQGTAVVIIACIIVGVYLYGADEAFRRLIDKVVLR